MTISILPACPWIAIEQILNRLFRSIDIDDRMGVLAIFAADGVWRRADGERSGRLEILAELERRPAGRRIEHLLSNLIIELPTEDVAEVSFRTLAFADETPILGRPSKMRHPIAIDAYQARFLKAENSWSLTYLEAERIFKSEDN